MKDTPDNVLPAPENPELKRFIGGLHRWAYGGVRPGSFLTSVLRNDLQGAFMFGDAESVKHLKDLLTYIYCNLPVDCWGSAERFAAWEASK